MKRWLMAFLVLLGAVGVAQELPQVNAPSRTPDAVYRFGLQAGQPTQLAPGDSRTEVAAYCSICHSTTYITMQPPLPGSVWKSEVEKMVKVHGAPIPPPAEAKIIAYLQAHYTPETRGVTAPPTPPAGEGSYMQTCVACHGDNGEGIPRLFPPLAGRASTIATQPGGRDYLMHVALFGLQGKIEAQGVPYDGVMPPWGKLLSDKAVADILTFVTHGWDAHANVRPFTAAEVQAARKAGLSSAQVHAERDRLHVR